MLRLTKILNYWNYCVYLWKKQIASSWKCVYLWGFYSGNESKKCPIWWSESSKSNKNLDSGVCCCVFLKKCLSFVSCHISDFGHLRFGSRPARHWHLEHPIQVHFTYIYIYLWHVHQLIPKWLSISCWGVASGFTGFRFKYRVEFFFQV